MASTERSSVVFSVQQLLDAESERIRAEQAERATRLQQEKATRLQSAEAERLQIERHNTQHHEHEWHQRMTQEANLLKAKLAQESEATLATVRGRLEHEYRFQKEQRDSQLSALTGRQRVLVTVLATLLAGACLCWLFVWLPGQRRASASYASLSDLYTKLLSEQREQADAWNRERRQLKSQIEAILTQPRSNLSPADSNNKFVTPQSKPPGRARPVDSKAPCICLRGDPMCDC